MSKPSARVGVAVGVVGVVGGAAAASPLCRNYGKRSNKGLKFGKKLVVKDMAASSGWGGETTSAISWNFSSGELAFSGHSRVGCAIVIYHRHLLTGGYGQGAGDINIVFNCYHWR